MTPREIMLGYVGNEKVWDAPPTAEQIVDTLLDLLDEAGYEIVPKSHN